MEKWSDELQARCKVLKANYQEIMEKISEAAVKSGRNQRILPCWPRRKRLPVEVINYGIDLGIPVIGENKVQEFLEKEEK